MNWADSIRIVNGLGSLVCLVLLVIAARNQWKGWNIKTQQHWWALFGWTALCLEASIEAILLNVEPGPRTVLTSLVLAWTLRALLIQEPLRADPALKYRKD